MTCRELAQIEYPLNVNETGRGGVVGCPSSKHYRYVSYEQSDQYCKGLKCDMCWDQEADEEAIKRVIGPTTDDVIGIEILHDFAKDVCGIDTSNMSVRETINAVQKYLSDPNTKLSQEHERMLYLVKEMFGIGSPSGKKFSDAIANMEIPKEDAITPFDADPNYKIVKPKILDSGDRTEFESGAVRDMREGKGRCDLLPLDVVANHLADKPSTVDDVLMHIYSFQNHNEVRCLYTALSAFARKRRWDDWTMLLEVAKHFEGGAKKYGDDNWRKGIPARVYIDSAVRHYLKWLRGDKDEPHDRAFCWNIMCCIWTWEHKPELNDYDKNALTVDDKTKDIMMYNTAVNNARKNKLNTNG